MEHEGILISGTHHILIVEDDEPFRSALTTAISLPGCKITWANDGEEALALLQRESFNLAVLDIKMPKVDGFTVLKFIKEKFPRMKAIMLTAHGDLMHVMQAKKFGADDFVDKPCDLAILQRMVERLLSG